MRVFCTLPLKKAADLLGSKKVGDNYTFLTLTFLRISERLFPAETPDFTGVSPSQCVGVCTLHARSYSTLKPQKGRIQ